MELGLACHALSGNLGRRLHLTTQLFKVSSGWRYSPDKSVAIGCIMVCNFWQTKLSYSLDSDFLRCKALYLNSWVRLQGWQKKTKNKWVNSICSLFIEFPIVGSNDNIQKQRHIKDLSNGNLILFFRWVIGKVGTKNSQNHIYRSYRKYAEKVRQNLLLIYCKAV